MRRRGVTLVEVLVAASLLGVGLSMAALMLAHTSHQAERGLLRIDAQRLARSAADAIASDLKQAAPLPLRAAGRLAVASAVFLPDPYAQADNGDSGRIVFSAPKRGRDDLGGLAAFHWVEYRPVRSATGPLRLVRRVVDVVDGAAPWGVRGLRYQDGWLLDPDALQDAAPLEERVITALPHPVDDVRVSVSHRPLPAPDQQLGIRFDRGLFRVVVDVRLHAGGDPGAQEAQSFETRASVLAF